MARSGFILLEETYDGNQKDYPKNRIGISGLTSDIGDQGAKISTKTM